MLYQHEKLRLLQPKQSIRRARKSMLRILSPLLAETK
jgi:hypothetical protein